MSKSGGDSDLHQRAATWLSTARGENEAPATEVMQGFVYDLQVYQVELAMQHEQLEQSRAEVAESLERYVERFDFAPVGYFTLEPDGRIVEANLVGAELFAVDRADLPGRSIENLVAADSRPALRAVLDRLCKDGPSEACEVYAEQAGGPRRLLQVVGKAAPRTRFLYVTFTFIRDDAAPDQQV